MALRLERWPKSPTTHGCVLGTSTAWLACRQDSKSLVPAVVTRSRVRCTTGGPDTCVDPPRGGYSFWGDVKVNSSVQRATVEGTAKYSTASWSDRWGSKEWATTFRTPAYAPIARSWTTSCRERQVSFPLSPGSQSREWALCGFGEKTSAANSRSASFDPDFCWMCAVSDFAPYSTAAARCPVSQKALAVRHIDGCRPSAVNIGPLARLERVGRAILLHLGGCPSSGAQDAPSVRTRRTAEAAAPWAVHRSLPRSV